MGTWGTVNLIYLEHLVLNYVSRIECVNCYTYMGRKRYVAFANTVRFHEVKIYIVARLYGQMVQQNQEMRQGFGTLCAFQILNCKLQKCRAFIRKIY